MTVSCVDYIVAWDSAFVIVSRIVNGIGYSCCPVCMSTWMSNLLPKEKIGSGMGMYGTMNALGMAIAPALGVSKSEKLGYKAVFLAATIFAALTVLMIQLKPLHRNVCYEKIFGWNLWKCEILLIVVYSLSYRP